MGSSSCILSLNMTRRSSVPRASEPFEFGSTEPFYVRGNTLRF